MTRSRKKPELLAPLRKVLGSYPHPHTAAGGFMLVLECDHTVHGSPREARQQRVRCTKCRDGKPRRQK